MALIILQQILVMAVYMVIGYLLCKGGKITDAGSKSFANLLAWIIIPCTIINSFLTGFTAQKLYAFGISFLLGSFTVFLAAVIGTVIFRGYGVEMFAVAFSNAGFIGIPLIRAAIGEEGVFYLVGFLITFNVLQWSCARTLLKEGRWISKKSGAGGRESGKGGLRHFLMNPMLIASLAGFLLFVCNLGEKVPEIFRNCVGSLASINTPLAMIVLGVYLAQSDLLSLFTTKRLYFVSAVRLILVPLVVILIFSLLPVDSRIRMTLVIAAAAPVGANVTVYSQIYDGDYLYACKTVTQSTLFSILIMPLIIQIANMLIPV